MPGAEIIGVGVGAPGPLDTKSGIVLLTPNLGWVNLPLRQIIHDRLGLPAALDNDANCAVLGEWWMGAARGARNAIGITIGTGIGGGHHPRRQAVPRRVGLRRRDRPHHHRHRGPPLQVRQLRLPRGLRLGTQHRAAGRARRSRPAPMSRLPQYVGGDLRRSPPRPCTRPRTTATNSPSRWSTTPPSFSASASPTWSTSSIPEVVVVCGGVTLAGDHLFVPLRREVARRAFKPAVSVCRIVPGELTGTAGVYGAAKAFLDQTRA